MFFVIFILASLSLLILSIVFLVVKKEKTFIPILVISVLVFAICIISVFFTGGSISKPSLKNNVSKNQIEIVESYLNEKYNSDYKVKKSNYVFNGEGFTGGLHQYYFLLKNKSGKKIEATYKSYNGLTKQTVINIIIKEL